MAEVQTMLVLSAYKGLYKPAGEPEVPYGKAWVVPARLVTEVTGRGNLGQQPVEVSIGVEGFEVLAAHGLPGIYEGEYDLSEFGGKVKRRFRSLVQVGTLEF